MKISEIANKFLSYYQSKGFFKIASAPLVHPLFPTSFNMSAGLVQLDPKIRSLTKIKPYKQCLVQKCFRNFDLNKVGDKSHLSFFEMAGSFEVGDFDEKKTIEDIWWLMTQILKIDSKQLWITFFDKETISNKLIFLPKHLKKYLFDLVGNRAIKGTKNTNFWTQGGGANLTDNIKLCGPQIEFYYDFGVNKGCQKNICNPFCGCGRFLEIANTILIKYYLDFNEDTKLKDLINATTETVIGIERATAVIENNNDVFATSCFFPLIQVFNNSISPSNSIKVIIDHIKSLVFILSEEAIQPTKNNRGRIIRTLIRNMLTSFYVLGLSPQEYIPLLIDKVIQIYEQQYPEINKNKISTLRIIFYHEKEYKNTLEIGKKKINLYLKKNNLSTLTETDKEYFWQKFGIPKILISTLL